jgi:hypothetical protein
MHRHPPPTPHPPSASDREGGEDMWQVEIELELDFLRHVQVQLAQVQLRVYIWVKALKALV